MMNTTQGYTCSSCGEFHHDLPLSYGADAPALWYDVLPQEIETRTVLSADQCIIDGNYFYVLGRLEIPILDASELFSWMVWVSLSEKNFDRMAELWETEGREKEPPYFGWLSTALPCYTNTMNLKTHVHTQPVGEPPLVELEATNHPLSLEQHKGITMARVQAIAQCVLHG